MRSWHQLIVLLPLLAGCCCNFAQQAQDAIVQEHVRQINEVERQERAAEESQHIEAIREQLVHRKQSLEPEIRRSMHEIAGEEVQIDQLESELETLDTVVEKQSSEILKLKSFLDTGEETFEIGGNRFSREEVADDLAVRFERYKRMEASQEIRATQLEARREALEAAKERLQLMMEEVAALNVEIAADAPRPVEELIDLADVEYRIKRAETPASDER